MADPIAAGDEVPEADRLEQDMSVEDVEAPDPALPFTQSWDADEGDRLEQSIEVPDDEERDRDQ